ncbi:PAP2 superfamily protein [Oxobacter pfennigii]|uniref:PAP2 superfamily protein n=1 Tax=Oxobacter pfennigii TaxID=36849 RepID=A0A0P8WKB6_9CLOT|nr:hypothetical protein [Oxobacter pfennigii]KPU42732.1 PAP2 superfamily protein [Oxobacter pfennigii]
MRGMQLFLSQHKHFYLLLLLIPYLILFKYIEATIVPKYIIHIGLDDKIPFIKEFIIPYLMWFGYMFYGVIFLGIHSKWDFYKLFVFVAGGMFLCLILYIVFPNAQDLRPKALGDDIFSNLIKLMYMVDTPTNVCPSIHVFDTIAVDIALRKSEHFRKIKYGRTVSTIISVSICLSTVFIKQHSALDAIYAVIMVIIFYIPIYIIWESKIKAYPSKEALKEAS